MSSSARGVVINMHRLGATLRLVDGRLAALPVRDVMEHRAFLQENMYKKRALPFLLEERGRRLVASISAETLAFRAAPELVNPAFEERMVTYLKSLEERGSPARPESAERWLMRKQRRREVVEASRAGRGS